MLNIGINALVKYVNKGFHSTLVFECKDELYSWGDSQIIASLVYHSLWPLYEKKISTLLVSISRVNETLELVVTYTATYEMRFSLFPKSDFRYHKGSVAYTAMVVILIYQSFLYATYSTFLFITQWLFTGVRYAWLSNGFFPFTKCCVSWINCLVVNELFLHELVHFCWNSLRLVDTERCASNASNCFNMRV